MLDETDLPSVVKTETGEEYRLEDLVGSGGFGSCYLARQITTNDIAVCKIVSKKSKPENEILIHKTLTHEHVLRFIAAIEERDHWCILLAPCINGSIHDLLLGRTCLSTTEVRYFMKHILSGLQYIHQNGIIHRDIKPRNLLIDEYMQTKIADFGLSVEINNPRKYKFCGTIHFVPPEVIEERGFGTKSDIWATGVTAFRLSFGVKPFDGSDKEAICEQILAGKYRVQENIDIDYNHFLKATIVKDLENRLTANECLSHPFLANEYIPLALPFATYSRSLFDDQLSQSKPKYPQIAISAKHIPMQNVISYENIFNTWKHFHATCCLQQLDAVFDEYEYLIRIDDMVENLRPKSWAECVHYEPSLGMVYKMRGNIAILCLNDDTLRFGESQWFSKIDNEFRSISKENLKFKDRLTELDVFLKKQNDFVTTQNTRNQAGIFHSTYLLSWLQIKIQMEEVTALLFSNMVLQINFNKEKLILISLSRESVTIIKGDNTEVISFKGMFLRPWNQIMEKETLLQTTAILKCIADHLSHQQA